MLRVEVLALSRNLLQTKDSVASALAQLHHPLFSQLCHGLHPSGPSCLGLPAEGGGRNGAIVYAGCHGEIPQTGRLKQQLSHGSGG
jgi:hypothetical protein